MSRSHEIEAVVVAFNGCINRRDLTGLATLMTDDHVFIDSGGATHRGKATMKGQWKQFFASFPDYRNHFEVIVSDGNRVAVAGHSTCSVQALHGPALWSARVSNGLVVEWRVYHDTEANRRLLGLPA